MKDLLLELTDLVEEFGSSPKLEEMPHRSLLDKGINGPTAAHVLEEIHTPLNLAYVTFTTGSSAFQNIVGVTHAELPARIAASKLALAKAGINKGDKILVTYPPLVNVFSKQALEDYGVKWFFLKRSSRDAALAALYEHKPQVVLGESSFLRVMLEDAKNMNVIEALPRDMIFLTAGTPLDLELLAIAKDTLNAKVYDLYGCQEFGWLAINGELLREDIELVALPNLKSREFYELVVGGLPMGDSFPLSETGHVCNPVGKLITYRRERTYPEFEVLIKETTLASKTTAERLARTILRIKGRVVKVCPELKTNAEKNILLLVPSISTGKSIEPILIKDKTKMFDDLLTAQLNYQQSSKADPVWIKRN